MYAFGYELMTWRQQERFQYGVQEFVNFGKFQGKDAKLATISASDVTIMKIFVIIPISLWISTRCASCKTIQGVLSSKDARLNNGQYITSFCFYGTSVLYCAVIAIIVVLRNIEYCNTFIPSTLSKSLLSVWCLNYFIFM